MKLQGSVLTRFASVQYRVQEGPSQFQSILTPKQCLVADQRVEQGFFVGAQLGAFLTFVEGEMEPRRSEAKPGARPHSLEVEEDRLLRVHTNNKAIGANTLAQDLSEHAMGHGLELYVYACNLSL